MGKQLSFNDVNPDFGTIRERWRHDIWCTCLQEGKDPFSFFVGPDDDEICCHCHYKRRFICLKGQMVHPDIMPILYEDVDREKGTYRFRGYYIRSLHLNSFRSD